MLYAVMIRPVVVIPDIPEAVVEDEIQSEPHRPPDNVLVAETFIPHAEWAAESKYMLRSDQAYFYTEHWKQVPDNQKQVRFEKFAIVYLTTDKEGNEQAFSIVSDEALVEFSAAFDERTPNPGRIIRAVLIGDVQIAGPDGLSVIGQNFIFDESELKLQTFYPVTFRYQSHRGSASRMTMGLIPGKGLPGKDRPHIYGVETVQLLANKSLPSQSLVQLELQVPQGDTQRDVLVQCAGDLIYSVATNTIVLTEDVIASTGPKDLNDRLGCHKLTLQFTPKKPAADEVVAEVKEPTGEESLPKDEYQQIERDLEFSWLEAEGKPGKQLMIISMSQKAKAYMDRLTYSAESKVLLMSSGTSGRAVRVTQKGSELKVPEIEAQLDQVPGEPVGLESLICRGPGALNYVDEKTGKLAFVATWEKQLSKTTDPDTRLDLIELEETAHFGIPDHKSGLIETGLIAELIKIWLAPIKLTAPGVEDGPAEETPPPELKRVLAQRDVGLKSPQLRIRRTNELDVRFEPAVAAIPVSSAPKNRTSLVPSSLTTRGRGQIGFASIPATADATAFPNSEASEKSSPTTRNPLASQGSGKPIFVSADQIAVRVRQVEGTQTPELVAVRSEGNVNITQEGAPGERPLELEGDVVKLDNQGVQREVIEISGKPAQIRDHRFRLEGKDIYLNRGDNEAKVKGSGWMKIAIPDQAQVPGVEKTGNRDLNVRWDEAMRFDGLEARFVGRVEAKLGQASMLCEQMNVQLQERLSFQSDNMTQEPAIRLVRCRENVRFENSTHVERKLVDKYRGRVGEFTWYHETGDIEAQGPGQVQVWRRQQKGSHAISPRETSQANRPIPVEISEWDYTRVQFEGKLEGRVDGHLSGNSDRQRVTIDDRVEVIYGPVNSPNDIVDPDNLPSRAGTLRCSSLEFLNHPKSKSNPVEYREMICRGNSEVEGQVDGRRFTASADEIIYDGSTSLYILNAQGKQTARLTRVGEATLGGGRIHFNPVTRGWKVIGASDGQGSGFQ
ncbi:hypothetical protein [Schlesneria sp. DSM 10557]|uniref:hypothetical protein n=1 Tax=Schlesneria sp. DSM 10557 TaxID=3044399 RepID=UPI0035A131DE